MDQISTLPRELLIMLGQYLPLADLASMSLTSVDMKKRLHSTLYRQLVIRDSPSAMRLCLRAFKNATVLEHTRDIKILFTSPVSFSAYTPQLLQDYQPISLHTFMNTRLSMQLSHESLLFWSVALANYTKSASGPCALLVCLMIRQYPARFRHLNVADDNHGDALPDFFELLSRAQMYPASLLSMTIRTESSESCSLQIPAGLEVLRCTGSPRALRPCSLTSSTLNLRVCSVVGALNGCAMFIELLKAQALPMLEDLTVDDWSYDQRADYECLVKLLNSKCAALQSLSLDVAYYTGGHIDSVGDMVDLNAPLDTKIQLPKLVKLRLPKDHLITYGVAFDIHDLAQWINQMVSSPLRAIDVTGFDFNTLVDMLCPTKVRPACALLRQRNVTSIRLVADDDNDLYQCIYVDNLDEYEQNLSQFKETCREEGIDAKIARRPASSTPTSELMWDA